jgi:hypothetical protein
MLLEATFAQLAAVLQPLTALQSLTLFYLGLLGDLTQEQQTTTDPEQVTVRPAVAEQSVVGWVQLQPYLEQQKKELDQAVAEEEGYDSFWGLLQLQPACFHTATGVYALVLAVNKLPCLTAVELQLPVGMNPTAVTPGLHHQSEELSRCPRWDGRACSLAGCGRGYVWSMHGTRQVLA